MRINIKETDNIPELTEFFEPEQQSSVSLNIQVTDNIPELSEELSPTTTQVNIDAAVAEAIAKLMPTIKAEVKKAVLIKLTSLEKELCDELENQMKEKVAAQLTELISRQQDKA